MGKGLGVEKREKSIRLFFVVDGQEFRETLRIDGKVLAPTPANLKFAERTARDIRKKIDAGDFRLADFFPDSPRAARTVAGGVLLKDLLDTWLSTQRIANSTRRGYLSVIGIWKQALVDQVPFGDFPVTKILPSDVDKALATKPDISGKTFNNLVSVLRPALDMAVRDRVIQSNPTSHIENAKWQRPPVEPFSKAEFEEILAAVDKLDLEQGAKDQVRNQIDFWLHTGLRTGELFGLRWASIDMAGKSMLIHESRVDAEQIESTKTATARRVHLNSRALAALQRQAAHTGKDEFVWHDTRYGLPWELPATFTHQVWERLLPLTSVPYRRPYNCRHTYATQLLMAGLKPAFCATQMGHSIDVFHRTYARWINGQADLDQMARLEQALAGE